LPGSQNNRLKKKDPSQPNKVLLDTNFKIDFNGEPLCFIDTEKQFIQETLQSDCEFLAKNNIVDYSLLLLIVPEIK
jgi:hypothetical protein